MQQIPVTAANTQALRAYKTKPRHHAHGAVALEFLMLFPFVVAMLYGAAVYGLTFFAKYQMQNAVDRAVETALYLDRSAYDDSQWQTAASQRANQTLSVLVSQLPSSLQGLDTSNACGVETVGTTALLRCQLVYASYASNPVVPALNFGMLGQFPPLPAQLDAQARTAF